jgi:hypothetical protein
MGGTASVPSHFSPCYPGGKELCFRFFGEAFFNILTILEKCQREMPNGREFEIQVQSSEPIKGSKRAYKKAEAAPV